MRSSPGLALFALAALAGCSDVPDSGGRAPATSSEAALELFELARVDEPATERIDELFGSVEDEQARAALLDSIAALPAADEIEIVETYPMEDLVRVSFDLVGRLPGGGIARYSVQLNTVTEPGTIVWFSGPGVEWPQRKSRGPGLSTSAPPTPPGGG